MEIEIVHRRENPLLKRVEVRFSVSHPKASTPPRDELRKALATALHATKDIVILDHTRSEFGRFVSRGYAKVYKAKEDALRIERKHILVRNALLQAEVKKEKPKVKPAPAPRPAAPAKEAAPKTAEKAPAPAKEDKPAAEKKEEKAAPAKAEKKAEAKKPAKEAK